MKKGGSPVQISPEQDLLLTAVLHPGKEWVSAFRKWEQLVSIDQIDTASFYLLPALSRKLSSHSLSSTHYAKMQGSYRHIWANNQRKMKGLQQLLQRCSERKIPTLLIKGASLLATHYREKGVRYMADQDLVVPEESLSALADLLLEEGYTAKEGVCLQKTLFNPRFRKVEHAVSFVNREGDELDVHWHVLDECCFPEVTRYFWSGSRPIVLGSSSTRCLNSADHLLLIGVHGFRWNPFPSFRWLLDGAALLQGSDDPIDWDRLIHFAEQWNLTKPMGGFLSMLDRYGVAVPPLSLSRIMAHRVTRHYAAEYRHRLAPRTHAWSRLLHRWYSHCRRHPSRSWLSRFIRFPSHFKDLYVLKSCLLLPWLLVKKLANPPPFLCAQKNKLPAFRRR